MSRGLAPKRGRIGSEIAVVFAGLAAMVIGSTLLVEAVRRITSVESTQTKLGLTVVGFATAFELVVLAWSAARRGETEVALAGVVGSFGYNMTMSLGAGALVKPLEVSDAASLRLPGVIMMIVFVGVISMAIPARGLGRGMGALLLCAYPAFVLVVVLL